MKKLNLWQKQLLDKYKAKKMFTNRDKIKEQVEFFINNKETQCLISRNPNYEPVGVSIVLTYKYDIRDIEVIYNKWFVECYDVAKQMNLPGCEHHGKLVKGTGVTALSKKMGIYTFYGKDANEIINACEFGRDLNAYMITNNPQKR